MGVVEVVGCGMVVLQCASVSKWTVSVYLLSVSSPIQLTALTYHWPTEGLITALLDPLITDLSSLAPYTPVTLATLSLEGTPPGSV